MCNAGSVTASPSSAQRRIEKNAMGTEGGSRRKENARRGR